MRLFAAILPPPDAVAELARAVDRLRLRTAALPGADALRWTERANWHLTLAFYGQVPEEALPGLCEGLERTARGSRPIQLSLAGAGAFGQRALWASVAGETEELGRLAGSSADAGRREGRGMDESHGFRAHLTVAYVRRRKARAGFELAPYTDCLAGFRGTAWTAGELVLVRSHLPDGGTGGEHPRYERVAGWPLGR